MKLSREALKFYKKFPIEKALIEKIPEGMSLRKACLDGIISTDEKTRMVEFFQTSTFLKF